MLNEASIEELEERLELSCWLDGCNSSYLDGICEQSYLDGWQFGCPSGTCNSQYGGE